MQTRPSPIAALVKAMNGAGVVWIFALMFLICADIAGRTLFDRPLQAVPEIVSMSLIACVFLQIAFAIRRDRLTRAEILLGYAREHRPTLAGAALIVSALAGLVVFACIAAGAWPDFWRAAATGEFVGVEGIYTLPVAPIKFFVVLGCVIAALSYAVVVVGLARNQPQRSAVLAAAIVITVVIGAAMMWRSMPGDGAIGVAAIVTVLVLIAAGMPIAVALLLVGFVGLAMLKRDFGIAVDTLSLAAQGTVSEYVFATVPLFVLMGLFVSLSEIGRDSFRAAQHAFGRLKGGLGVATVAANAVFAAITGISIASAAIFAKIAVPEMMARGYSARFAVGLTAGSSVLGMLIPPSLLLIIYGVLAEVSIGALFLAAVVPGIVLALAFAAGVVVMAQLWPEFVGRPHAGTGDDARPMSAGGAFVAFLPVLLLIALVLGGIYGGVFTPTEAGAAGAFAAMCIALLRRRLGLKALWDVIGETGQVTVSILFLIISASTFSRMLTLTGLPTAMAEFLGGLGLGLGGFLAGYLIVLIALGTVLDSTSILLILLPLALPVVSALGGDLIWFGIVTVIGVEIGLLTPPLGLSVYVIQSTLDDPRITLGTIFRGAFPFVLITVAVTILLMAFPGLSLVFQ
jgi:C4-dicarboxylate transporter DctM subunit